MSQDIEIQNQVQVYSEPLPEKTTFPKSGFLNGRIRYNILMNISVLALIIIPFFIPTIYSIGIQYFFVSQWLVFFVLYLISSIKLYKNHKIQAKQQINQPQIAVKINNGFENIDQDTNICMNSVQRTRFYKYNHIMMTFIYKEPLELLSNTLSNIQQLINSSELTVVIGIEERTPDKENKILALKEKYGQIFEDLIITVHPFGQDGEIPGKCSNSNYAQRQLFAHLNSTRPDFNLESYMITNFDTDTRFQKNYLTVLEKEIQKNCRAENDIHNIVWQPVLFYNWELNQRTFFVRITSLIRNMFMMGVLIPLQLNVMSVFSFSLKLCVSGNYTHPAYQMDDIICYIRWFIKSQKQIQIKPVYSATLSGPTSGATFYEEFCEWARQIRRWTIGSAEVFHYYLIKSKYIQPNLKFTIWGFLYFNYYALFLIAQSFFMISCAISFNLVRNDLSETEFYLQIGQIASQYLIIILMFFVNGASQKLLDPIREKEKINLILTFFHIIFSPLTLILYAFVAFYGLSEVVFRGKQVCKHGASKKQELK